MQPCWTRTWTRQLRGTNCVQPFPRSTGSCGNHICSYYISNNIFRYILNLKYSQLAYDEKYLSYPYPIFYYGRRYRDILNRIHWSVLKSACPEVLDYPRFTKRLLDTDIKSGHSAYLEVVVAGSPAVDVKWYRNGVPLIETSNVYVSNCI